MESVIQDGINKLSNHHRQLMKIEFFVTGSGQDCGIATYTTTLENALSVEHARTPLKLRSLNVLHYVVQSVRAGFTDADVVHVQHEYDIYGPKSFASWLVFPILWLLTALRKRPLVVTYHSAWGEETVKPPFERLKWVYLWLNNQLLAAVTDHGIFLSEDTRETFERTAPLSSVEVLPHGVPTDLHPMSQDEAKRELGVISDQPLVAEPGFIRPQKGYHLFVDVAERVSDVTFLIGGGIHEGNYEEYMTDLRERCGDEIGITGVLDDNEFHALFNAMDVALLPYETVTQSGILNWCLAYEVPVVGTDVGQFSGLHAEHGFPLVFPQADPEAGATAVQALLADPEPVLEKMQTYRDNHGMDTVASAHEALYRSLV